MGRLFVLEHKPEQPSIAHSTAHSIVHSIVHDEYGHGIILVKKAAIEQKGGGSIWEDSRHRREYGKSRAEPATGG